MGWDRERANAQKAQRRGAIHAIARSLDDAIANVELIVLAAPLRAIEKILSRVLAKARAGALVLDVGPLKQSIATIARKSLSRSPRAAQFVAGHPIAGSERSGPDAACADLFKGRPFALYAPKQPKEKLARRKAEAIVNAIGAVPVWLEPAAHDRAVASTSALPQLTAIALALAAQQTLGRGQPKLAGPGLESATRLADSPFHVWDDALFGNKRNVQRALRSLERHIAALGAILQRGSRREMSDRFRAAAAAKRRILETPRRSNRPHKS